jgi:Fe2+ transport system protein B
MLSLITLTIFTAFAIKFLHYCIGSPVQGEFYTGRIFSAYGAFISKLYLDFEAKEKNRVWAIYNAWKQKRDKELNEELQNKTANEADTIYKDYLQQIQHVYKDVENNMKNNPWSIAGACPICFGTWISLIISFFFVIFVMLPWWSIFICTPTAVILSRYIKIY